MPVKRFSFAKEIADKRFAPCDLGACRHACCSHGAMVGPERINKIGKLLPKLFPMMRPEAVRAVQKKGFHLDSVYSRFDMDQSHEHHYLRTVKGRCVFLAFDDDGGCVLQKYAKMHNIKYKLKPVGCWAFPFDLIGSRLVLYKWKGLPCLDDNINKNAPLIYKSCKNELLGLLGQDGYKDLLLKMESKKLSSKK